MYDIILKQRVCGGKYLVKKRCTSCYFVYYK